MGLIRTFPAVSAPAALLIIVALGLSAAGCGNQDPCAVDDDPCGGNPTGEWMIDKNRSCRDPVFRPPLAITYLGQPKGAAREIPPEATSSDWCSYLEYGPNGTITGFIFPFDALPITGGRVRYQEDGTFNVLMAMQGTGSVELSASCLTQFGATPSCSALATALADYAESQPSYSGIQCADAGHGGCRCTYDLSFDNTINGRWSLQGGVINHFDANQFLPSQVGFCVAPSGKELKMWGRNRTSIWDQPGVRTLMLGQ